jgi:hypothetical protein
MRKFPLFLALFLACFSLYGQTLREARIYVPPIDGAGRTADNDYFFRQLIYEIILQYHTTAKSLRDSDYTLKGTIEPVNGEPEEEPVVIQDSTYSPVPDRPVPPVRNSFGRREFFSMDTGGEIYFFDTSGEDNSRAPPAPPVKDSASLQNTQEEGEKYYFILEISDSKTGEILENQSIIFIRPDASVKELLSTVVYNMLSGIPEILMQNESRNESIFFEIGIIWTPRIYYGGYESINWLNFGVKFGLEFQILKFMAVGAGAQITLDRIDNDAGDFRDLQLEAPVSIRYVQKLGEKYIIEPYAGAAWNYSLGGLTQPSMFSWFAGFQFGMKAGSGMIIFEPRFSMDFFDSVLLEDDTEYGRYCIQLGIGYKYNAFQKKGKTQE